MITKQQYGFSLVELSIVLIIIGSLAGTAIGPFVASMQLSRYKQVQRQLQSVREAMHGYFVSVGRLPCPVKLDSVVIDHGHPTEICTQAAGGVPAALLGLMGERAPNGALLDTWGRPIRYAVSLADQDEHGTSGLPDWLSVGEPGSVGTENLIADLQLCRTAASGNCPALDLIADQIVWVVYSLGERSDAIGMQIENQDGDRVFVVSGFSSHPDSPFDDQVIWASRSELVYWLLKANWLP